jgi:RimJ/RimL family protein N-acetyltransferase
MTMIPTLETDRLILRAHTLADMDAFAAFYASEHSRFVGGPITRERAWRSMAQEMGNWVLRGFGRWAVALKDTNEWIGIAGLWFPEGFPERELGWDIAEEHTRKGYATEAGRAVRAYAYGTLGWDTLISLVADGNEASVGVAHKLGAWHEGTFVHEHFGPAHVYRHPGPDDLDDSDGSVEAYA